MDCDLFNEPAMDEFAALAKLHRRAERAISHARFLCEQNRMVRDRLRGNLDSIHRGIADLAPRAADR